MCELLTNALRGRATQMAHRMGGDVLPRHQSRQLPRNLFAAQSAAEFRSALKRKPARKGADRERFELLGAARGASPQSVRRFRLAGGAERREFERALSRVHT
jgi:hypothetical protein